MSIGRWFKRQWALERETFIDMAFEACLFIVTVGPVVVALAIFGGVPKGGAG